MMIRIPLQLGVALLTLVAGIASTGSSADHEHALQGPVTQGCRFTVTSDRDSYRYDQPIRLRLKFENVEKDSVLVEKTNLMVVYRFEVRRLGDEKPVSLTREGKREESMPIFSNMVIPIKRGESDTGYVPMLNRLYDMSLLGEYTVTVYRQNVWPSEIDKPFEVPSNTLKIVVRDYNAEETKALQQQESNK